VPIVFHPSWPAPARALLCRAIDRHGGWSRWTRLEAISVHLVALRGFLPWIKGYGRSFQLGRSLTTFPKEIRTEFHEDTGQRHLATFDRGDMRLHGPETGRARAEGQSRDHRRTFAGWRKMRRWDAVDAHYFFGYAFASYAALPFVLPGLSYRGGVMARARGERWTGVRVEFPADAQVHCRRQSYFFDDSGLLRRNDYVADVVGAFARGAHLWRDYSTVQGLALPARRTVLLRLGATPLPFVTALDATLNGLDVRLRDKEGPANFASGPGAFGGQSIPA